MALEMLMKISAPVMLVKLWGKEAASIILRVIKDSSLQNFDKHTQTHSHTLTKPDL